MPARTIQLPNLRRLIIPDKGKVICESDLEQADAQVVAAEANDDKLRDIFADPNRDLHNENALTIFGPPLTSHRRHLAKTGVHLTNYGGSARTLSQSLGISLHESQAFQSIWFENHPGIPAWHKKTEYLLGTDGYLYNRFGYRKYFRSHPRKAFTEALAWTPQSTVAIIIHKAWLHIMRRLKEIEILIHCHDSLVFQCYPSYLMKNLKVLQSCFNDIIIPYPRPLTIPAGLSISMKSWGDVKETNWHPDKVLKALQ